MFIKINSGEYIPLLEKRSKFIASAAPMAKKEDYYEVIPRAL